MSGDPTPVEWRVVDHKGRSTLVTAVEERAYEQRESLTRLRPEAGPYRVQMRPRPAAPPWTDVEDPA